MSSSNNNCHHRNLSEMSGAELKQLLDWYFRLCNFTRLDIEILEAEIKLTQLRNRKSKHQIMSLNRQMDQFISQAI